MMKHSTLVMKKRRLVSGRVMWAAAALAVGSACSEKGEGLVVVQLSSSQSIARATVVVASPPDASVLGVASHDWLATQPLQLGIYVPKSVSGTVDIVACGFDSVGTLIASTPNDRGSYTASVQPGAATAPVPITLAPGANPALCAALAGTGGHGGSTGVGGMAAGGSGGSNASGGSGGSGGTAGSGSGGQAGAGGTGGGAGGGTGGAAGGAAGKGGAAGSGAGGGAGAVVNGMWQAGGAAVANDAASYETFPSVAVDPSGNAVVVYEHDDLIYGAYYAASQGKWGAPFVIDGRGGVGAKPSVAVDKNGNYLAVWGMDTSMTTRGIWQSTSVNGTTWKPPTSIAVTHDWGPVLAMNANGAAIVAWSEEVQDGSSDVQAVAAVRAAGTTTWSTQVLRKAADYGTRDPAVAIDGKGNAFVAWTESSAAFYYEVWMAEYVAGGGWSAGSPFETSPDGNTYDPQLAANDGGDVILSYIQITGGSSPKVQVWTRRYDASMSKWATYPLMVTSGYYIDTAVAPAVTLDNTGNATEAWAVETSVGYNVYTSRTSAVDAMWPASGTAMETDDIAMDDDKNNSLDYVTMPVMRNDPAGNVFLVWRKRTTSSGARFDLVARRYDITTGAWGPQAALENDTTNSVFWPTLAVGANGTAVATWYFGTILDVWANVYH
jgi:hypothetical protein